MNFERELIAFIFPNSNVLVAIVRDLQVVKLYSSTGVQFLMGQGCQLTQFSIDWVSDVVIIVIMHDDGVFVW